MSSTGAPESQVTCWDEGEPAAKMPRPRSPPRLNLTGMALPAFETLTVGGLSTGWKKPVKVYRNGGGFFASSCGVMVSLSTVTVGRSGVTPARPIAPPLSLRLAQSLYPLSVVLTVSLLMSNDTPVSVELPLQFQSMAPLASLTAT